MKLHHAGAKSHLEWEKPMPKAVIFDVDGTLVDSVDFHAKAWVEAFKQHGYEVPFEAVRQQIGKGGEQIVEEFIPEAERDITSDLTQYRKKFYQQNFLQQVRPFPKVRELFERLRGDGIKVVLASSGRKESIEHYQNLLNIKDLIDGTTSTEDVEAAKPNPDIFIAAMDKIEGIDASEILVVGDSPYDAQAATKIPLRTIGVLCGGFSEEQLTDAGCIAVYQDPADLLAHYPQCLLGERRSEAA
jgi:HAD superfamily hydrolase (TIGR01549 family)